MKNYGIFIDRQDGGFLIIEKNSCSYSRINEIKDGFLTRESAQKALNRMFK